LNLNDAVIIETFRSRMEAEMAASWLEAEGIEVLVLADDAGGAYPMLQFLRGVRLLVAPEDEARAKEVLQAMQQGAPEVPEENPDEADK
jgi:predicted Fe-Mo cluster-binding NifX family protein